MIGQTLGHYSIVEKIGAGGMGEVYRAHDEQLDRDVALKVLPTGTLPNEAARRHFRQEALALAKLNHPNIETVHEFSTQNGVDFLAMELIPGNSLAQRLKHGPLPEQELVRLAIQFAEGLAFAHEHGVIHRDLKPGNLMITPDGRLKILDFGLARLLLPGQDTDRTQSISTTAGAIAGTVPYMSPEQLRGLLVDARSDIYSAGSVLYEMATGNRPFHQSQSAELIGAILHEKPDPPSSRNRHVSAVLECVVMKALDKEPARRYQSARELCVALEGVAVGSAKIVKSRWPLFATAGVAVALILLMGLLLGLNIGGLADRLLHRGTPSGASSAPIRARRSVAVLGFKNVSARPDVAWLSTGLSEMLTTELAAGEHVRTVAEENVARVKTDLSLSDADSLASDTLARLRKNLGADYVVLGSYVDLGKEAGNQVRVDLRLQDARTGETVAVVSQIGKESELFDLVSRTGTELRNKLGIGEVSEQEARGVRAALSSNTDAARLYAEGLAKLRVFDALAARDLLGKAVAADPDYALAHSALAAAWSALGYDTTAAAEAKKAFELSAGLPREDRLVIQGRYYEATKNWPKAIEVYRTLWNFSPDDLNYGLRLAYAQISSSNAKDALVTIDALRKLPPPASDDPRIDLAEDLAARGLSDFKRELAAATKAEEKGNAEGARLLVAQAKLAEGRALYSLGNTKESQNASEDAQKIFAAAGDLNGEATALHNIATVMEDRGDTTGAKKMQDDALQVCRKIGNQKCVADVLNSLGIYFKNHADFSNAQRFYEQALAIRREVGDRIGQATALSSIGVLLYQNGKLAAANKIYQQALAISREIGDKRGTVRALTNLAIDLRVQGDLAGSRKALEESLSIRRAIGDKVGVGIALNNLAELLIDLGDLDAAQKAVDEQLAIDQQAGNQRGLAYARFVHGEILSARGNLDEARKAYEEALAIRERTGEKTTAEEARIALGMVSIEQGRPADAVQPAREVLKLAREENEPGTQIAAEMLLARSLLGTDKLIEATKQIAAAEALAAANEDRLQRLEVTITAATVRTAARPAEATKSLEGAFKEATRIGCFRCQLEARLALGQIVIKREPSAGRAQLASLQKDAADKGFLLIASKAAASLGK